MDHTLHTPLSAEDLNEANLIDAVIYGPNEEKIGTIAHVHGMGATMQVIVDVGGFLGIGSKSVALDVREMKFTRDENGVAHAVTSWSKEQVKNMPEHHH